jgi:dihydropteroate synthase
MSDGQHVWQFPGRVLTIGRRPLVMAIINVTPDSFSDGGQFIGLDAAIAHALACVEQGADLLDIGGESTRPGAQPITEEEELRRVLPVVEALRGRVSVPLSIDTSKAAVARACLEAGAEIINDVTALGGDPDMAAVVSTARAGVILMHMQGTPATMQQNPHYDNVMVEIGQFLEARLQRAFAAGIARESVVLDPGIGFGKTSKHNLEILGRLVELQRLGRPVCLGVSRKGFIGRLLNQRPMERRLAGSLAAVCHAQCRQAVQIARVHDVEATADAVTILAALQEYEGGGGP